MSLLLSPYGGAPHRELLVVQASLNPFIPEAATGGVLEEKAFLKISQNSQENTFARTLFLYKLQA